VESSRHPVRLVLTDDGRRSRLTVFFRLFLALPHLIWLVGWSIVAQTASFANWLAVVISGETPPVFHSFLGAYVRYVTHVSAYLFLAANPYPGFVGRPGYPVDVEFEPPGRQRRLSAAFRLVLAVPTLLLGASLVGGGLGVESAALVTAAVLLWFTALALGRVSSGLRDLTHYSLGYSAQMLAYVLLVVGRYPDSHPDHMLPGSAPARHPVRLRVEDGLRRSRLTTLFRFPLAAPHLVWLSGWSVLALLAAVAAWFAALVTGRTPRPLHRFLAAYVRYASHVTAFLSLVGNPFPGFVGREGSYPVEIAIDGPASQRRVVTLFRLFLALPALLVSNALWSVLFVAALLLWPVALVRGSVPAGLRALAIRYGAQASAYLLLVTARYPDATPTLRRPLPAPEESPA
jgi:hypothetical protein